MSGEEGSGKEGLIKRAINKGKSLLTRRETGISRGSFMVDTLGFEGDANPRIVELIYKKNYLSFNELKKELEKNGYHMSIPYRDEQFADNRVGADIYDQGGKLICGATFEASSDLTKGSAISPNRPALNPPKK